MRPWLLATALCLTAAVLPAQSPDDGLPYPTRGDQARVLFGRFTVLESPDRSEANGLERFIRSRESQLRFCYAEQGLSFDSTLTAFAHVTFWLNAERRADSVRLRPLLAEGQRALPATMVACLQNRVRSWQFPEGFQRSVAAFYLGLTRDPTAPPRTGHW